MLAAFFNAEIEEWVEFAKNYEHGKRVEVWEDGKQVEEFEK